MACIIDRAPCSLPRPSLLRKMASNAPSTTLQSINPPERFNYLFRHIRNFPRRIMHPPSLENVPRVGTVRSFKLTPSYRVQLDDVIAGRHLPPLGRKEFEDFLYFKEHSEENLYFYIWLAQYEAQWNAWANTVQHTSSNAHPNRRLAMSYARAKETFFNPGSLWELNLPQRTLHQLLHDTHPGPKLHPHPSAFAGVRFEVENYLNESLTR